MWSISLLESYVEALETLVNSQFWWLICWYWYPRLLSPSALWQGSSPKAWSQPQLFTDEEIFRFQLSQGVAWLQWHQKKLPIWRGVPKFQTLISGNFRGLLHLGLIIWVWDKKHRILGWNMNTLEVDILQRLSARCCRSQEFNMSFWIEGPHRLYMGFS